MRLPKIDFCINGLGLFSPLDLLYGGFDHGGIPDIQVGDQVGACQALSAACRCSTAE